ncbi:hypothetical protein T12_14397 [Trichinella patagoniensis]|uniref:Peptidase A2 domain-containing protein n=1 Tax=Trichinella patagoniensis TaxID=990121 RepID=A0A0V0ZG94_9BILA|nr:hypothetical protein T12_14397 [Trichinella patagoniensis]
MAHGEKGKKKLVNCLLDTGSERSLIRSDVADELDLQGPTKTMTVKGVNGLHVRIADVRRVQFRLPPLPSKGLEPFNEGIELTALSLPSLCDDLVATPTPCLKIRVGYRRRRFRGRDDVISNEEFIIFCIDFNRWNKVPNSNQIVKRNYNISWCHEPGGRNLKILVFIPREEVGDDEATSADRTEAPARCHHSNAQYAEARRAQLALEDALPDGEALEATLREWHELSNEVFETRNQAGIFLKEKGNGPAVNPKQTASLTSAAEQVKPPRVPLPKFDGDILQFKSFWDQFESSIHQQEALKAIEGVTICAENYPEVVQTLKTRFYRIPDVVESHVLSVMNVKACSNEGAGKLTRLHDDLNRHFLELKALGKDVNCGLSGFHVILPALKRKLPSGTVTEWKTFVKDKKDDEIRSDNEGPNDKEPHHNARNPDLRFTTAAVQMEPGGGCPVCKGDHLADCCPRFRSYSVEQRRHWAMRLKLCFVCLAQGHRRERCQKRQSNQFWNPLLAGGAVPAGKAPPKQASSSARSYGIDSTEEKALLSRNPNEKVEDVGLLSEDSPVGIHLSSTEGQTAIRLPVVRAMAHGEKGKKKLVNCLLDTGSERSLIRSDVADELDLQGPTRAMTVKGVNGLHVRIADVRRVQFRLTPIPSKGLEPFNEGIELTALSLPSLCDDLVATPTPWFCKDKIPSLPEFSNVNAELPSTDGLKLK